MNGWIEENNALHKTFTFKTFPEAMQWMQKASVEIDKLNHHPEWTNIYNTVKVKLYTHTAGDTVTAKDHQLASILDNC
jgi:4a-hydroxytetrahydrobiopterin dehydratase